MEQYNDEIDIQLNRILLSRPKTSNYTLVKDEIDIDIDPTVYFMAKKIAELYILKEDSKNSNVTYRLIRETVFASFCIGVKYIHNSNDAISAFVYYHNKDSLDKIKRSELVFREKMILNELNYDLHKIVTHREFLEYFLRKHRKGSDITPLANLTSCISLLFLIKLDSPVNGLIKLSTVDDWILSFCCFFLAACCLNIDNGHRGVKEINDVVKIGDEHFKTKTFEIAQFRSILYFLLNKIKIIQREGFSFKSFWSTMGKKIDDQIIKPICESENSSSMDTMNESPTRGSLSPENPLYIDDVSDVSENHNDEEALDDGQDQDFGISNDISQDDTIENLNNLGDGFNWVSSFQIIKELDFSKVKFFLNSIIPQDNSEDNVAIFTYNKSFESLFDEMSNNRLIFDKDLENLCLISDDLTSDDLTELPIYKELEIDCKEDSGKDFKEDPGKESDSNKKKRKYGTI